MNLLALCDGLHGVITAPNLVMAKSATQLRIDLSA